MVATKVIVLFNLAKIFMFYSQSLRFSQLIASTCLLLDASNQSHFVIWLFYFRFYKINTFWVDELSTLMGALFKSILLYFKIWKKISSIEEKKT